MTEKFNITGMTCSACSAHVEKSVRGVPGVRQVNVSLLTNSMTAEYDEAQAKAEDIIAAVESGGYGASQAGGSAAASAAPAKAAAPAQNASASLKRTLIWSLGLLVPLMYVSMGHMMGLPLPHIFHENGVIFALTQFFIALPIVLLNKRFFRGGFKALFHGAPNMDTLIAVGSGAALLYGVFAIFVMAAALGRGDTQTVAAYSMNLYFEGAAMILALITLGKYLESRSKGKTTAALEKLMDLAPKTAIVLRGGEEMEIPAEDVAVGDIVIVKPGAGIPVDGVVTEGHSSVDESAITGESIPVEKAEGDKLTAGTINKGGYLRMEARQIGADTAIAQIARLVEEAASSKAPVQKLADKVSGIFVPVVMAIAAVTIVVWLLLGEDFEFALNMGISVLVISCPCALGLATPVAIMVGTGRGAQSGILIKSAEALERAEKLDAVVFDKTGTITLGQPAVTDIFAADESRLLSLAAAVERQSEHPLAEAVVRAAQEAGVEIPDAQNFASREGRGVEADVGSSHVLAGNAKFLREAGIAFAEREELADAGKTPLYFAVDGAYLGAVAVADPIKDTSPAAVARLAEMGMEVAMITGDNERTARAIGKRAGIGEVIAGVLPADKEKRVRAMQEAGASVAMVGDGINDAPALARADVGIAIGAGTDIAIDSADMVLMRSDPGDVCVAVALSHAVMRNIRQNLFWAFFYNVLGIPLAAGVFYGLLGWTLNPMFAAAAMSLSSVTVVSNALRLRFFDGAKPLRGMRRHRDAHTIIMKEKTKGEKTMKTVMIQGMSCQHCVAHVKKALEALPGVESVEVSLEDRAARVQGSADNETLIKAVAEAGYEAVEVR